MTVEILAEVREQEIRFYNSLYFGKPQLTRAIRKLPEIQHGLLLVYPEPTVSSVARAAVNNWSQNTIDSKLENIWF